jgi:uncharacterized protein (DUF1330 family)
MRRDAISSIQEPAGKRDMKGYLIANIDVHDARAFDQYRQKVSPLIERFGGRYLVRGGKLRNLEGDLALKRLIVLELPSLAEAERFYDSPEYRPLLELRATCTTSHVVIVEGYAG